MYHTLHWSTIHTLISASNLTSLKLDFNGVKVGPNTCRGDYQGHICPSIAALFTTLHTLKLRMSNVCVDVLKPEPHSATNLSLAELIIDIRMSGRVNYHLAAEKRASFTAGLKKQAQILATQMRNPKMVKIIQKRQFCGRWVSLVWDALTGTSVKLDENGCWWDDAEPVESDASEEDYI